MKCFFCGSDDHGFKCPMIKAYEYHADGKIRRIEFVTLADLVKSPEQAISSLPAHPTRQ